MDFLKKAQAAVGGNTNTANNNTQAPANTAPAAGSSNAGTEDYGDKGLDFIQKKTGHVFGRDTNEKITDGARGLYEKATGSKVDPKYSN